MKTTLINCFFSTYLLFIKLIRYYSFILAQHCTEHECTANDVNSHCNVLQCECNDGFHADESSKKCVKGTYHND